MTKIQLRRDTAANWSTNNPTPSAGEPCFETDTGKLKIGDGITAYNSLPYQGGTSDTAVTTNTEQEITGLKTFTNDINISQWTSGSSSIRETHIDFSRGNGNAFISAEGTDKAFGMYGSSSTGIQLGTSKTDFTQGLSIKPSSLTFKSSDGTVTDLLAGGSGDVTSAGNNIFTGINIFKGKSLNVGDDNNYTDIASFSGTAYTVGDQADTTIINPVELGASFTNTVLKSNVKVLETDTASATKKAYSIMTKSPTNNEYMGHMAMPSNKYINLELGASGTTYTAPADGWVSLNCQTIINAPNAEKRYVFLQVNSKTRDNAYRDIKWFENAHTNLEYGGIIPITKGDIFLVGYAEGSTLSVESREFGLCFIYAVGSEPSS